MPVACRAAPVSPNFQAGWSFASADPENEQPGLSVVASPDRGDGARMSWIEMADTPDGLAVNFYGYDPTLGGTCSDLTNFVYTEIASGLDRTQPHSIIVEMFLLDGPNNDVVRVYVDLELVHEGKSWEDFFRLCQPVDGTEAVSRTVDSVLFRVAGAAAPATAGLGFLLDNFGASSHLIGTTLDPEPVILVGDLPAIEMAATLTSELGEPLAGKNLVFKTTEVLCEATTDENGRAFCEALGSMVQILQATGTYFAEFEGDLIYAGAQERSGLIGLFSRRAGGRPGLRPGRLWTGGCPAQAFLRPGCPAVGPKPKRTNRHFRAGETRGDAEQGSDREPRRAAGMEERG